MTEGETAGWRNMKKARGGSGKARGGETRSRMEERVEIRKEWREASVDS